MYGGIVKKFSNLTSLHNIFISNCRAFIREAVKIHRIDARDPEIGNPDY